MILISFTITFMVRCLTGHNSADAGISPFIRNPTPTTCENRFLVS